ncbi:MAG: hypothetical protein JO026_01585 [Patescibacteria group bacterium]|nr:hypothetical protein [Patescibacteria group bacterium]
MQNRAVVIVLSIVLLIILGALYFRHESDALKTSTSVIAASSSPLSAQPSSSPASTGNPATLAPSVPAASIRLLAISPSTASVGDTVTLTGIGFTASNTVLMDGLLAGGGKASILNGKQTISFTVPQALAPNCKAKQMCPQFMRQTTAGSYEVTVENANGSSNVLVLTVSGEAKAVSTY